MKRRYYWLLFLPFVIAVFAWICSIKPPNLFAHARRVPGVHSEDFQWLYDQAWLSTSLISLHEIASDGTTRFLDLDINTGAEHLHSVKYPGKTSNQGDQSPISSPDGSKLLFRTAHSWLLTDSSGERIQDWPLWGDNVLWSPDSKDWIIYRYESNEVRIYPAGQAGWHKTKNPIHASTIRWYEGNGTVGLQVGSVPGEPQFYKANTLTGTVYPLNFKAPPGLFQISEIAPSPGGDRIAWYVGRKTVQPHWVERFLAFFGHQKPGPMGMMPNGRQGPPPYETEGIWISRSDGSDLQEIGEVKAEWAPAGMGGFKWCPDGKHLIVTYKNGFYVVPLV